MAGWAPGAAFAAAALSGASGARGRFGALGAGLRAGPADAAVSPARWWRSPGNAGARSLTDCPRSFFGNFLSFVDPASRGPHGPGFTDSDRWGEKLLFS